MDNYCSTCRHVRTAMRLGCVSEVTGADELFCGLHPPQVGDATIRQETVYNTPPGILPEPHYKTFRAEPVCLPRCNDGKGYRGMACWKPDDDTVLFALTLKELEALKALIELRCELLRVAPAGTAESLDLSTLIERVNGGLGFLRERLAGRSR